MIMNGCSTGWPPIHVKIIVFVSSVQNKIWVIGRNVALRCLDVCSRGTNIRIRIENKRARTPPSLFGMERRMA